VLEAGLGREQTHGFLSWPAHRGARRRDYCGRSEIFPHGGARQEAERLGAEFLGEVPLDLKIRETSGGGAPITVSDPDNPDALVFRRIGARIWEKVAGAGAERRTPPRIVIE
jgi:ATP-binding protein involved in chromosome partitioning